MNHILTILFFFLSKTFTHMHVPFLQCLWFLLCTRSFQCKTKVPPVFNKIKTEPQRPLLDLTGRKAWVVQSPEKAMAPHSSTLAWKSPWMEEPGRLQSMRLRTVGHDWATSLPLFTFTPWRRTWQPTAVFLTGESQGRRSLVRSSEDRN